MSNDKHDTHVLRDIFPLPNDMRAPELVSDERFEQLFADELKPAVALNAAMKRLEEVMHKPSEPEPASVPELFFHTKKRRLPDIYECRDCGYQFPAEASCPKCNSKNYGVFMRAPAPSEIARRTADRESELADIDPEWRERFHGDTDLAWDFYRPKSPGYVVHSSPFEPPSYIDNPGFRDDDDDAAFDGGLSDLDDPR